MKQLHQLWQNPKRLIRTLIVMAIVLFAVQGINLWAGAGQVIDAETGKPLEGVFAIAMWHASGHSPVDSRTVCYNFAITQTEKDGTYHLPFFSWNFFPFYTNRQRYQEFYLPGYETLPDDRLMDAVIRMRKYKGTVGQRLQSFLHQRYENCTSEGERKGKLGPLYREQLDEAINNAAKGADVSYVNAAGYPDTFVNTLTRRWESATLPYDAKHRNADGTLK